MLEPCSYHLKCNFVTVLGRGEFCACFANFVEELFTVYPIYKSVSYQIAAWDNFQIVSCIWKPSSSNCHILHSFQKIRTLGHKEATSKISFAYWVPSNIWSLIQEGKSSQSTGCTAMACILLGLLRPNEGPMTCAHCVVPLQSYTGQVCECIVAYALRAVI